MDVSTQRDVKEEDIQNDSDAIELQPSCLLLQKIDYQSVLITAHPTTSLTDALDPASQTLSRTIRRAAPVSPDCRRFSRDSRKPIQFEHGLSFDMVSDGLSRRRTNKPLTVATENQGAHTLRIICAGARQRCRSHAAQPRSRPPPFREGKRIHTRPECDQTGAHVCGALCRRSRTRPR